MKLVRLLARCEPKDADEVVSAKANEKKSRERASELTVRGLIERRLREHELGLKEKGSCNETGKGTTGRHVKAGMVVVWVPWGKRTWESPG